MIITLHSLEHLMNSEIYGAFKNLLNDNGHIFFEVPNCPQEYFDKRASDSLSPTFLYEKKF